MCDVSEGHCNYHYYSLLCTAVIRVGKVTKVIYNILFVTFVESNPL